MNVLCFGGSFNPIHHGHLVCARAVAESAGFERVVLIPSARPPHKLDTGHLVSAVHRLQMCRCATQHSSLFDVADLELFRAGPSYTLETARELKKRGYNTVNWLIGADTVPTLPSWHEPEALLREVDFWVMDRPGFAIDWQALGPGYQPLRQRVVPAPLIQISASEIRARAAIGRSIDYLTPPEVVAYIRANGLYQ